MTQRLVLICLVCIGCGGASPEQKFVGTWSFASGTDNVSCPNGATSVSLKGNETITHDAAGGLLVLDAESCNFSYTVSGNDAALSGKNTCDFAVPELGQGVTAHVVYDTIRLSTSDGNSMRDTFSGKVTYTSSSGALDCVFSGSATLSKL